MPSHPANNTGPCVAVCQLGPRRRYAVARAYHQVGALECLLTDLCVARGWPRLLHLLPGGLRPDAIRRILERHPEGIPPARVDHFPAFGVWYARATRGAGTASRRSEIFVQGGQRFGALVARRGFGKATAVHVFNTAGVEILKASKARGLRSVLDQTIAPKGEEVRLLAEYHQRHPEWEDAPESDSFAGALAEREREEWTLADQVVCGSDFVRQALLAEGVPAERCTVVPTGIDLARQGAPRSAPPAGRPGHDRPLRVLVVGHVNLRKGVATTAAVARALGKRATVRLVGPVQVRPEAARGLAEVSEVLGSVPRSEVTAHYQWADVFLLPSIVEGSAVATYEALAQCLPLVCTSNAGSIIRDGVEGYLVPPDDPSAVVAAMEQLMNDPDRLHAMGQAGRQRLEVATLEAYAEGLLKLAR